MARDEDVTGSGDFEAAMTSGERGRTRGEFLTAMGVGALTLAGISACGGSSPAASTSSKGGVVDLWTWANYWSPSNLKGFTTSTGTTIQQANYPSNDVMFAKMNSPAASSYDMVVPTSGWVPLLAQRGLIAELDKSRLPLQYIRNDLKGRNYDPQGKYSVPKDWGVFGVIYDPAKVKYPIRTWNDYLTVGAKPGISGQVAASNTADETLGIGMWSLGIDWNTTNTADITRGAAVMKAFDSHVKAYESAPIQQMVSGEFAMAVISHGDARAALIQKPSLRFVVPGPASELWIDSYCITKNAQHPAQAYSFISYMLQPERQITDTAYVGYPTGLPNLEEQLPSSVKLKQAIFVPPAVLQGCSSRITNPNTQGLIATLYNEIVGASG